MACECAEVSQGGRTVRGGLKGMSKEEVTVVAEVSGEITAEAPTVIFYSAYHIVGHMHTPPPTRDRATIAEFYHQIL